MSETENYFMFERKCYIQASGTTIWTPDTHSYAKIIVGDWEEEFNDNHITSFCDSVTQYWGMFWSATVPVYIM